MVEQDPERKNPSSSVGSSGNEGTQGNVAANVGGNQIGTQNNYFHRKDSPVESQSQRNPTQQILLDSVDEEVNSHLIHSLHNRISIDLEKEEDPNQVRPPWSVDVKIGSGEPFPLPSNTTIADIYYRKDINGRLLILGEPGSGKTTTMLQLAEVLVKRAKERQNQPIPVLLNLSSWQDDKQTIRGWIVEELKFKYGLRKDIGEKFLKEKVVLPLLDGLDELKSERQEGCVKKLNEFLSKGKGKFFPLIVCSRTEEYQLYEENLALNGSIILQLLNLEQIEDYIFQTEGEGFWRCIENDAQVLDLAKTPLLLNMLVISASEISFDQWQGFTSSEERRSYLFAAYIRKMLNRKYKKRKQPREEDTRRWLGWLAKRLLEDNQTEFSIEHLQARWLRSKRKKFIYWLIVGLIVGLIYGLITGLTEEIIELIETLSFSWINFTEKLIGWLIVGLIVGLIGWLIVGLIGCLIYGLIGWLIDGLIGWRIYGLIGWMIFRFITELIFDLSGTEIIKKKQPNERIKQSIKNAAILCLILIPIATIILLVLQSLLEPAIVSSNPELSNDLMFILLPLIVCGILFYSTVPAIKHFSLRLVLWRSDRAPWNYAKFLDYATDRMFLQRVGGGYRFLHKLLQEHFAQLSTNKQQTTNN